MSFDVKFQEVQDLQNDYGLFTRSVADAVSNADAQVRSLVGLASFEGAGAAAIKGYFGDMHLTLLKALDLLVNQLATMYAARYYSKFLTTPISEASSNARWSEDTMAKASQLLDALVQNNVSDIDHEIAAARAICPPDGELTFPSTSDLTSGIEQTKHNVNEVKSGVSIVEEGAASEFSDGSGEFAFLAGAIERTIDQCAAGSVPMGGYARTLACATAGGTGLYQAMAACERYQEASKDVLNQAREDCKNAQIARLEQRIKDAEEDKNHWLSYASGDQGLKDMQDAWAKASPFDTSRPIGGAMKGLEDFATSVTGDENNLVSQLLKGGREAGFNATYSGAASAAIGRTGDCVSAVALGEVNRAQEVIDGAREKLDALQGSPNGPDCVFV